MSENKEMIESEEMTEAVETVAPVVDEVIEQTVVEAVESDETPVEETVEAPVADDTAESSTLHYRIAKACVKQNVNARLLKHLDIGKSKQLGVNVDSKLAASKGVLLSSSLQYLPVNAVSDSAREMAHHT